MPTLLKEWNDHERNPDESPTRTGTGMPPPVAQSAVRGLGQELLTGLGQQNWSSKQSMSIKELQLESLSIDNPHDAEGLRQAIAQAVIRAIVQKTKSRR